MENKFTRWIIITCLLSLVIPAITAGINYFMDPLWCFSLSHNYNNKQDDFNERQQKTNYITFHDFHYDAIIVGSSTSTCINQKDFKGLPVFNYASNGMQPLEYQKYIRYAIERNGREFNYIFLGLDFLFAVKLPQPVIDADRVLADTNSPLYRFKSLISIDTLRFSRRNFMNHLYGRHIYYDRDNIKYLTPITREDQERNMKLLMAHFENSKASYSFKNFSYDGSYPSILRTIRDGSPHSKFVVFTTPVIQPFMTSMVKHGLLGDYLRWIRDIVNVYGECYHFMYPNRYSADYLKYFHDPNHYYSTVSDRMADAIYNRKINGDTDFGMYINKSNLEEKLRQLERLMKEAAARN
jgi:hypothetical protein